jgi:hypothetical protein
MCRVAALFQVTQKLLIDLLLEAEPGRPYDDRLQLSDHTIHNMSSFYLEFRGIANGSPSM